jgi:RNA polymerase sigma-70 factor, ECF subfamily
MQGKKLPSRAESCFFLGPSDIKFIATRPLRHCNKITAAGDILVSRRNCEVGCVKLAEDWQTIVNENGPLVWRTAYRLLANHADSADCFQETFLAALELSRRQPVRNMAGLLVRLATTRAIDRLRQRGRQEQRPADAAERRQSAGPSDPHEEVQAQELVGQLREAIGQLPPQEAKVFCLRYLSEMSYRQIARELGIGTSVVGVSLYRAKAKLREALGAAEIEEDEVQHERT